MNSENNNFRERLGYLIGKESPFVWAKRVGIPSGTFARIWNEGTVPKYEHLCKISDVCNVSLDWLLKGEGEMHTPKNFKDLFKQLCELPKLNYDFASEFKKALEDGDYESFEQKLLNLYSAYEKPEEAPLELGEKPLKPLTLPINLNKNPQVSIPEIDVLAGCGGGGIPATAIQNGLETDAVKSSWAFPLEYIKSLNIDARDLRILELNGDSMAPTLNSGEKVFINLGDRNPSPSGIFALWDGFGCVVKRIERIMHKEEETIKVISDNPHYSSYELTASEANIIGRVICFIRRC